MRKILPATGLAIAIALVAAAAPAVSQQQTVAAPRAPAAARQHLRVLPLQGGQNFRDLGGYRTTDGRTTRWGLLYRSGAMNQLTDADFDYIAARGIRTVCDFRSTDERKSAPAGWPAGKAPAIFADDYKMDNSAMRAAMKPPLSGESAKAGMAALYPGLLEQFNGQYRRMFGELLAGRAPLAFNCTAGKDRTGVAAALILTSLGVPRETVIQDYLLTNQYLKTDKVKKDDPSMQQWAQLPPEIAKAFLAADRSYIESVFKVMDAHPGGVDGYLSDKLGLGKVERATLRRFYTE